MARYRQVFIFPGGYGSYHLQNESSSTLLMYQFILGDPTTRFSAERRQNVRT